MKNSNYVKLLETILDAIYEGIFVTDPKGKIIIYNNEIAKWENLSKNRVIGKHIMDVYEVDEENSEHLMTTKSGQPIYGKHKKVFPKNGKEVDIIADTVPVFDGDKLVAVYSVCRNITKIKELLETTIHLRNQIGMDPSTNKKNGTNYTFESIIHSSPRMKKLIISAKRAAKADYPVIVYGETGTGKELLVQGIHNHSNRCIERFIAINCAAIPETLLESMLFGTVKGAFTGAIDSPGLFEQAGAGTLFLDEINSMSPSLQAKLLRVLQEKYVRRVGGKVDISINCRIVSSINMDPWECIKLGSLRKDLFYRLAVVSLFVPPLRVRKEDIDVLLDFFLNKFEKIYGKAGIEVAPDVRKYLSQHQWPGNVRELEHVIESSITMLGEGKIIKAEHLPGYLKMKISPINTENLYIKESRPLSSILNEVEKQVIVETLKKNQGNITKSAAVLGIARQNLQYRMRKLGIKQECFPS